MAPLVPVILCGGSGTRLWPVSRTDFPKPFHGLGQAHSLLQQTVRRLYRPVRPGAAPAIVVANEAHRFIAAQQLADVAAPLGALILEPQGRNTAPAVTLAALRLAATDQPQAVMLITPADHHVADDAAWWAAVDGGRAAAAAGAAVLFGVRPERAETGYGYIHAGLRRADGARSVIGFVEKPDGPEAARLSHAPQHFWNSGMVLVRADVWLAALARHQPAMLQACRAAMVQARDDGDFVRPAPAAFLGCPAHSIDRGVLEPMARESPGAAALAMGDLACGWSDVGAWDAVLQRAPRDASGCAAQGPHLMLDCTDTLVLSGGRLVAAVGLKDLVVVETSDAVLVAHRSSAQQVQAVVQRLGNEGREQWLRSQTAVQRPWGWFDVIGRGANWVAKRIGVRPGASLSLQRHRHRAEHWTVVQGVAEVWCDGRSIRLERYASTFVARGQLHRLANAGPLPLELIELQTGDVVSEDDIERFDDAYGRVDAAAAAPAVAN